MYITFIPQPENTHIQGLITWPNKCEQNHFKCIFNLFSYQLIIAKSTYSTIQTMYKLHYNYSVVSDHNGM